MSNDADGALGCMFFVVVGICLWVWFADGVPQKNEILMKICGDGTRIIVNTKTGKMYASGFPFSRQVYSDDVCGR